ncbi:MAG: hypothetical protein GX587_00915 [Bacteroidales bacterium]|nr:hypothetical protein [Bacteroidales bacterium]
MPRLRVLITVTTYPLPSRSYDELVCTAGILENGEWIRIYPVPLEFMRGMKIKGSFRKFKYTWIELNLKRRNKDDFRPESYSPVDYSFKDLEVFESLGTKNFWQERKEICLKNVYTNLETLIAESREPANKSLATFKPKQILKFRAVPDDREWKPEWKAQLQQLQLDFENTSESSKKRELIRKLPYKFYYDFIDENNKLSKMMIEDWEIGELFWNCLKDSNGDEDAAVEKVKQKYFDTFTQKNDIYFFLGTTNEWHRRRSPNPFVIIGVFYPLKDTDTQLSLEL